MSSRPSQRLFLLDGMALLYRAHFAFINNPIRTSQGFVTSALLGFLNTLLLLKEAGKPTHLACAFDTSEPTARHKLFPEYKAHRQAMPEELSAQIPHIFRLLEALNIPILRVPGYEADDIIGSLAKQADASLAFDTYMVTPDKDFGQLVSAHSFIWKPGRKGSEYSIIDEPTLLSEWEITNPAQVIDILALMGDSSDNIPGVPGIGPKTAKDLISQFGSVENLLANLDKLKGKRKETLEQNADKATLSKILATIDTQVPLEHTLEDFLCQAPQEQALKALLAEFEFKSLERRLFPQHPGKKTPPAPPRSEEDLPLFDSTQNPVLAPTKKTSSKVKTEASSSVLTPEDELFLYDNSASHSFHTLESIPHTYTLVSSPQDRAALLERLVTAPKWCFDTETTGLNPLSDELLGIAFCFQAHEAFFVPIESPEELLFFAPAFLSHAQKIGHNLKFDLSVLMSHGLRPAGPFVDTMLLHALLSPGHKHGMDYLAEILLNYIPLKLIDLLPEPPAKKEALDMRSIPLEKLAPYAAEDADITLQLSEILLKQVEEKGQLSLYQNIEAPLIEALAHCELTGINLDLGLLEQASLQLEQELSLLQTEILELAGEPFNLNSPKQLGLILFDKLQLVAKPKKTKTGQYVTDEETLQSLAHTHPLVEKILSYREANKLKSTYVDALPRFISPMDGRIHTQFLQLITSTGRLASQDPNLQNIPIRSEAGKEIRAAFIPKNSSYLLLSADYSQIELRIMAALSEDKNLIAAFESGRDIHTETAALLFGVPATEVSADQRRAAKTVNFGIIYGISAFGLSQRLNLPRAQAAHIIESYFTQFPGVKVFMDKTIAEAREQGYVSTLNNRRRYLPEIHSMNANIRQGAERMAINTPIQGTAADMIKIAMARVEQFLTEQNCRSQLLLQIHDELVLDLHQEEAFVQTEVVSLMENALILPSQVPIVVEARTGKNWLLAH